MREHDLKIWPEYFDSLANDQRTAEIRQNDRDFHVGDIIHFREWAPSSAAFTGRRVSRQVTYVFHGPFYHGAGGFAVVPQGYAILSLKPVGAPITTGSERPRYDCLAKLKPGEPYFVLRGQDKLSADLVDRWADEASAGGTPEPKVVDALETANRMREWSSRKHPD